MTDPVGFIHAGVTVLGVIEEVDWGSWDVAAQFASSFGVLGTSVIDGGLKIRPFSFQMILDGYVSQPARDSAIAQLELKIGKVGTFKAYNAIELFVNYTDVRFAGLRQGRSGYDAIHGYWRKCFFMFEQLAPPPVIP